MERFSLIYLHCLCYYNLLNVLSPMQPNAPEVLLNLYSSFYGMIYERFVPSFCLGFISSYWRLQPTSTFPESAERTRDARTLERNQPGQKRLGEILLDRGIRYFAGVLPHRYFGLVHAASSAPNIPWRQPQLPDSRCRVPLINHESKIKYETRSLAYGGGIGTVLQYNEASAPLLFSSASMLQFLSILLVQRPLSLKSSSTTL